jgi:threonine dehydrogenase-like Zn-dependent dehydrogenase
VHVFDLVREGPKPKLVTDIGAEFHNESLPDSGLTPDIVLECTGVPSVVVDALTHNAVNGIVCLTGVSSGGRQIPLDVGDINRRWVLENDVVFGTVNANRRHYEAAAQALADADQAWLSRLITRRLPLADFADGFAKQPDDVKVVLTIP